MLFEDIYSKTGTKYGFLSTSVFPMLGTDSDYFKLVDVNDKNQLVKDGSFEIETNKKRMNNPYSNSSYTHDHIITAHPRFEVFTSHCKLRTGKKPNILVPIYQDENTYLNYFNIDKHDYNNKFNYEKIKYNRINNLYCCDLIDNSDNSNNNKLTNTIEKPTFYNKIRHEKYPGYIHMDSFSSGMGNGCLQITFGLNNLNEALYIYDQFIPLTPILLALSASSSIVKGKLSGWDNRFNILVQGCDDRLDEEKDPKSKNYIYKSRYSNVYSYISSSPYIQDHHNEYPKMPIDKEYYNKLINKGFNKRFAEHICNLFVREPMIVFEKKVKVEDKEDPAHFISLMSTNWNSLRFKPPLVNDKDNFYKLEIRPADLQFSPFENAAINTFIILYSRILRYYGVNFIIPMKMNDINFEKGHLNNAVNNEKFFWRINSIDKEYYNLQNSIKKNGYNNSVFKIPDGYDNKEKDLECIKEMTLNEILNGKKEYGYIGILEVMKHFVLNLYKEKEQELLLGQLSFLSDRVNGKLLTGAQYLRKLVLDHKSYKKDSVVTQEIAYDVMSKVVDIQNYNYLPKEMFEGYEDLINNYKVTNDLNENIEKLDSGKKLKRDNRKCS